MTMQKVDAAMPVVIDERDDPALVVKRATAWATEMKKIIIAQKMAKKIGDKEFPLVEAWQLVFTFAGVSPVSEYVTAIKDDLGGELVGYEAKVNLIDASGNVVGAGIATCGMDSFPTRGREGYDIDRAAISTAQTWATAKAGRQKYGFVMKLAGYEATPAEEMLEEKAAGRAKRSTSAEVFDSGVCPDHDEPWFKKGKMREYAHKDGADWHNFPREELRGAFAAACAVTGADPAGLIASEIDQGKQWDDLTPQQAYAVIHAATAHGEEPVAPAEPDQVETPDDDLPF
jgi:hypothetical protein